MNVTVPNEASLLAFDFRFSQPGDGDSVSVSLNDVLFFTFAGRDLVDNAFKSVHIPVGNLAAKTGVLTVRLDSIRDRNAEIQVRDFRFLSPGQDTTSPATVTDLTTGPAGMTTVGLSWTAPGDDGNTGTAANYDVRYSTAGSITGENWAAAIPLGGLPSPSEAGVIENLTVPRLSCGTAYYFALKTADVAGNVSSISNSPSGTTAPCSDPALGLDLNGTSFRVGETLRVGATLTPGLGSAVDAYIVVRLPDGRLLSLQADGTLVLGIVPVATNFIPMSLQVELIHYVVNGTEPMGTYSWFAALTVPGTLDLIGGLVQKDFTFEP